MATETAATSVHNTLVAATADTITISNDGKTLRIQNRGASDIYYTLGLFGNAPTAAVAAANDTYCLPAGAVDSIETVDYGSSIIVSLISVGNPAYSVESFR